MNLNLKLVKKRALELGIKGDIELSHHKNKKYVISNTYGTIHFGNPLYEDFLIHKDENRRQKFWNRWKNNKYINDPSRPIYYSARLLW